MAEFAFVSVDTGKIGDFLIKSQEASVEFKAIKEEFNRINQDILNAWKGVGKTAYNTESSSILEKIGSVDDVLTAINETMADIRTTYSDFDEQLAQAIVEMMEQNEEGGSESNG